MEFKRTTKWIIRRRNLRYTFSFHPYDKRTRKLRWIVWPPGYIENAAHQYEFYSWEGAMIFINSRIKEERSDAT